MEAFPAELLTPPLPLVALLGIPDLALRIATHLQESNPPLACLLLPTRGDALEIASSKADVAGERAAELRSQPPAGILKTGWVRKHRERVAAAAVVLVEKEVISGPPDVWNELCNELDLLK